MEAYADALGHIVPHDLRRTYAKLAHKDGAAIEQISLNPGHSSIEVTERYLGVDLDYQNAPSDYIDITPCMTGNSGSRTLESSQPEPVQTGPRVSLYQLTCHHYRPLHWEVRSPSLQLEQVRDDHFQRFWPHLLVQRCLDIRRHEILIARHDVGGRAGEGLADIRLRT